MNHSYMKDLRQHIRKILKEETQLPLSVMRRINHLDDIFMKVRNEILGYACDFKNSNILLSYLYEKTLEEFYYTWMSEVVSDDDWETTAPEIEKYLDNNYRKSTEMFWNDECSKRRSFEKTELTEKCWKGYTQKGMKTMFGKRYPNCVKKTK